ncbi:DUF4124 domain-containing protein [Marinobacter sp. JSM 1782161]|uniref:DUF4124 domain-containing protein n=1 Tax=Marinobacter sp. JSM 1782161 TaxID=2685906 RepID=UPI001D18CCC0|nr:DUF4124 domain-containing protein [Marinobacter sp. JSM 1782161]
MTRRLMLLMVLLPLLAQAEIYRYTDENGVVHFGDRKLPDQRQETVEVRPSASDWQRFEIAIETRGDVTLSEAERARIEANVNLVYAFFDDVLYFDIHSTVPVNILVLPDRATYDRYVADNVPGPSPPSLGIFLGWRNQIAVYMQEDRAATLRTISHETAHAIVATLTPYVPAWLNEGLAEQAEMLLRDDGRLVIQAHPENTAVVDYLRRQGQLPEVDRFLAMQSRDWRSQYTDKGFSLQSQTGEFVYFLLASPTGRSFLVRLIHQYHRGDRTLAAYLVDDNYVGGMPVLQDNWGLWLRGARRDAINF